MKFSMRTPHFRHWMRAFLLAGCIAPVLSADARRAVEPTCWWETYDLPMSVGGGYYMLQFCSVGSAPPEYVGCMDFPLFGAPACP